MDGRDTPNCPHFTPVFDCGPRHSRVKFGVSQKNTNPLIRPILAIALSIAVSCGSVLAAPVATQQLPGHVPKIVAKLKSTGRLPGETSLNLAIGLPLRNREDLNNLNAQLYNPDSPLYRHYLTPEEFTEQFAPTEEDYQAVVNYAKSSGFTVTATHSDRLLLEVTATAADVERAFGVNMRLYPHPTQARSFYSPDRDPVVPGNLQIADIGGLNNFSYPHPKATRRRILGKHAAKNTSVDGSGTDGNFFFSDYRNAYIPGVTNTGTGQMIGLLEFDGYYASDVTAYESLAAMTKAPTVKPVLLAGFNGDPGTNNGEVALDIEMVMSMAPGLSEIVSFETSTNTPVTVLLSAMAASNKISQLTCSWDFISNNAVPYASMDTSFTKFIAQGQSFLDASGDSGAYYNGQIPEPDDDTNITLVGGTTLQTTSPGGPLFGEVSWNAPDLVSSSGGGISTNYTLPKWQEGLDTNGNGASTTFRNTPDVSIIADNVFIIADDGFYETSGGTSVSAQLWGGLVALINQQSVANGHGAIGFLNSNLYSFYRSSAYSADFNDIIMGNNTNGDSGGFYATADYDLCTGLGTPNGGSLIIALGSPDGFIVTPGRGFGASGPAGGPFGAMGPNGTPFATTSETISLANTGSNSLSWTLGGAPAWVTVSSTSGTIAHGAAPDAVTVALNSQAETLVPGWYTADLWFTNTTSHQAQLRQFTLQVGQNLIHDGGFETGDFAYWMDSNTTYYYDYVDDGYYTPFNAHSGNFYAVLSESNQVSDLYQTIPTVPGQPYLISYWLENPFGGTPNSFATEWISGHTTNILTSQTGLPAFGWQNSQYFALATTNTSTLLFASRNDTNAFALDDVSVVPVPFPTAQSTTLSGQTLSITFDSLSGLIYQVTIYLRSPPSLLQSRLPRLRQWRHHDHSGNHRADAGLLSRGAGHQLVTTVTRRAAASGAG